MDNVLVFGHKDLFIKASSALVKTIEQELKINNFLYDYGIDIANYINPAYGFLEDFVSDNYDDEHDNIIECLFSLAEYGVADVGDHDVTTVEEIYDVYFGDKT